MKIGVFDSGLGGLLVLRKVTKVLPQYDYYYYGDTAKLPYGDKSEEEIYELTKDALRHMLEADCMLIVIACNTASVETLPRIQSEFLPAEYPDRTVLGVVVPTVEALTSSDSRSALLLGTERTIDSGKYERVLRKQQSTIELLSKATPELVPLLESARGSEALEQIVSTIDAARTPELDTVILGCTHYALLTSKLRGHYGGGLEFLSQDEVIPLKLQKYLQKHPELEEKLSQGRDRKVHLTEHRDDYDRFLVSVLQGRST